jgi:lipoprotein NlpD
MRRAPLLLVLVLAIAACTSSAQAPISYGGSAPPVARRTATRPPPAEPDVVAGPARQHPSSDPNWAASPGPNLSDYALQPDVVQPYDPARLPRTYRVSGDESLYDVATRFQIPLRALIDQNHLEPPYALASGRTLQLPPPRLHRVARGESFEDVARAYNVDLRSLALLNRMSAPYLVRTGDPIVLPAMARAAPVTRIVSATPARTTPARTTPTRTTPTRTPQVPSQLPPTPTAVPPAAVGTANFSWPLRGNIVARFGAQPGGGRIDGLEIAGAEGAAINAADAGEVVYAGSDLPAYGTLVLVRHENGYVTAYGYARRALVREGQRVRAGEQIAEVGRIGSGPPRLLFQVRRGSEAIDPAPLLGG